MGFQKLLMFGISFFILTGGGVIYINYRSHVKAEKERIRMEAEQAEKLRLEQEALAKKIREWQIETQKKADAFQRSVGKPEEWNLVIK